MTDFNRHLGLVLSEDGAVVLETKPEHEVAPGTIHFAVLTTLAEVSAARSVGTPVVPVSVQVQLLRRASPGRLEARGTCSKSGRRLAFAEGEVFQAGTLVARASVTFAVL